MNCIIVQPRQTGPRLQAVDRNPMMIGSHQFKINESLDPNQADQRCMHTKQSITHFLLVNPRTRLLGAHRIYGAQKNCFAKIRFVQSWQPVFQFEPNTRFSCPVWVRSNIFSHKKRKPSNKSKNIPSIDFFWCNNCRRYRSPLRPSTAPSLRRSNRDLDDNQMITITPPKENALSKIFYHKSEESKNEQFDSTRRGRLHFGGY